METSSYLRDYQILPVPRQSRGFSKDNKLRHLTKPERGRRMRDVDVPESLVPLKSTRPFFKASEVAAAEIKYVAWIDILGTDSIMRRSMQITANFLTKLHMAALEARQSLSSHDALTLYPVVDGVYVTSANQDAILNHIKAMMASLAAVFVFEQDPLHRFMVRGGVAYGPVWEGRALMTESHHSLRNNPEYARQILLGPSVTQAHTSESSASPFGIWIHESARTFAPPDAPHSITNTHWHWWKHHHTGADDELAATLAQHLDAYFVWCKNNSTYILYRDDRIEAHHKLMKQYFRLS